ncbi:AAA family ATPase [Actinomycetospora endophytica]|uniref:AAA family ATPase n=1 Tax=Actinomycetospora endophytica TaxID=2291215 RepID=A0ABS8P778_9PSEU|nr:BTAD domain-containing putative transcriptional regulator [Actinomycetospora endophytica]MCD2194115.1 AAA family ATPase [Actinomycetospora endophytica]
MLSVRVLGEIRAVLDGRPLDLGSVQRRALLARLAVAAGEVVPTDRLVDDLWSGEPPPRALAGLQAHVSHLRRVLEPDRAPRTPATVLVSAAGGYALRVGDGLDTVRAAALLDRARTESPAAASATLREALDLFTGAPLADVADAGWARPEVERLTELRRTLVESRAAAELAEDPAHAAPAPVRAAAVVDLLAPAIRDEPWREEPVRLLALARYRTGRQAEALAAIAALRHRLADELGLDPSPGLAALERRILTHDPDLALPPHVRKDPFQTLDVRIPPLITTPEHPVVGRDAELDRLLAVADPHGPGRLVLVTGEAGAGKSTLADALRSALSGRGWQAVRGRCPEVDGAPPGWAWSEIAEALGGVTTTGADDPHRAFHAGRALVAALEAATRPLLVVLDDLHRGDEETWRLLRVVASAQVGGVLVLATFRPDEVGDDLVTTVAALTTVTAERLELDGLDAAAVRALVAGEGLEVDDEAAERIAARTGGNPLFVREVARFALTVGLDAARRTVPAGIRDVLSRRAAQLPAAAVSVLRRAAVLGRDVDVSVLVALEDGDEDRVLGACEAGVVTGLLTESGPDAVRFAHDLVRETLYDELPRLRRARVHAEALTVLERLRPADHAALARHALAAGPVAGVDRVLEHVERAARDARAEGAPRTAADLLTGALDLVPRTDPRRRLAIRCALATAHSHAGAGLPAVTHRTTALAEAAAVVGNGPLSDDGRAVLVDAATCVDGPVTFALAENADVDRPLVDTIERLLAEPIAAADRVRLLAVRAFAWHPREPARAVADAEAAVAALAEAGDDPDLRCLVLNARFWTLLRPDRWDDLDALGVELLDAAEAARSWGHRSVGHHARFLHACYREDFGAAGEHAARALAEAPDAQLASTLGWTTIFRALEALVAQRYDEAERIYTAVAASLAERGLANASALAMVGMIGVRHAQGRLAELVEPIAAEYRVRGALIAEPYTAALVAAGRPDEARRVWRPDLTISPDWWWLMWTALRAETAEALGDDEVLATCRRDLAPWEGHLAGAMSGTATLGRVRCAARS